MVMQRVFKIILGMMLVSLVACGKKEGRVGASGKPQGQKSGPVRSEPAGPSSRDNDSGGNLPGGVTEGPERLGPGGSRSPAPRNSRNVPEAERAEPGAGEGNLPGRGTQVRPEPRTSRPEAEAPQNPPRVDRGQGGGGNLPSDSVRIPVPTPAPRASTLPWYPPNLEGSPAEAWLYHNIDPVLQKLETSGPRPRVFSRRQMVTLAIGYFDGFESNPLTYDMVNYGQHAPVDPFLRAATHEVLTRPCRGLLSVCGFEMIHLDDTSALFRKMGYDGIIQEVRVISPALSERHAINTGARASEQRARSDKAERLFLESFKSSDLVIYVGHSRNGGGPDFHPPRLQGNRVNYPYYQANRPGLQKLTQAVRQNSRRAMGLALLSCDSTRWFQGAVRQAAPQMDLKTVQGQIYSEDLMAEGLVTLDYYLRLGTIAGLRH